jgi:hypothetical protein
LKLKERTTELQIIKHTNLNTEEKLIFYINIFNTLTIHIKIELDNHLPKSLDEQNFLLTQSSYMINKKVYTLKKLKEKILKYFNKLIEKESNHDVSKYVVLLLLIPLYNNLKDYENNIFFIKLNSQTLFGDIQKISKRILKSRIKIMEDRIVLPSYVFDILLESTENLQSVEEYKKGLYERFGVKYKRKSGLNFCEIDLSPKNVQGYFEDLIEVSLKNENQFNTKISKKNLYFNSGSSSEKVEDDIDIDEKSVESNEQLFDFEEENIYVLKKKISKKNVLNESDENIKIEMNQKENNQFENKKEINQFENNQKENGKSRLKSILKKSIFKRFSSEKKELNQSKSFRNRSKSLNEKINFENEIIDEENNLKNEPKIITSKSKRNILMNYNDLKILKNDEDFKNYLKYFKFNPIQFCFDLVKDSLEDFEIEIWKNCNCFIFDSFIF